MMIEGIVYALFEIYRTIYEKYDNLDENSIKEILYLSVLAESKFRNLNINEKNNRLTVLGMLVTNFDFVDSELPFGVEKNISKHDYPFYRLMARIKYEDNMGKMVANQFCESTKNFLDNQVAYMYNYLISFHNEDLKKRAYMILMNSFEVEQACLKNGLKPFSEIYDTLDFELEFRAIVEMMKLGVLDPTKVVDAAMGANEMRISYFISKIFQVSNSISYNGLADDIEKKVVRAYIDSLISILDDDDATCMIFEISDNVSRKDILDFIVDSFPDAEKVLKFKRKVSMVNEEDL